MPPVYSTACSCCVFTSQTKNIIGLLWIFVRKKERAELLNYGSLVMNGTICS